MGLSAFPEEAMMVRETVVDALKAGSEIAGARLPCVSLLCTRLVFECCVFAASHSQC